MKTLMTPFFTLIFVLFVPSFSSAAKPLIEDTPKECTYCDDWNIPLAPFQVYGNTWYVGTAGLATVLIATQEGLILIDGALAQSAGMIAENIRQTGHDPADIKIILNSHAHYDHAGGIAALQRFSSAQVMASQGSIDVLRTGKVGSDDPQYGFGVEANRFPAIQNVDLIGNGETVSLGNITLTAHYTPGHTPGGTTWTWQNCSDGQCLNMVYADSLSAVSADGFEFADSDLSPNAADLIRASTASIRELPCDVLLAPHPFLIKLNDKLKALATDAAENPFIESGACRAYADFFDDWLERRLAEEAEERSG